MSSNTFCLEICYEDHTKFAEKHREEIMNSLLYIKNNLPRTIINLILSPSKQFQNCMIQYLYNR